MRSILDPIFWMQIYADKNKAWTGRTDEPLFVTEDGRPLHRAVMIKWLRNMGQKVSYPNAQKLSGISFRRGGSQTLREQGYTFGRIGSLARWASEKNAARYTTLTDPIVDEFAGAFDKAEKKLKDKHK